MITTEQISYHREKTLRMLKALGNAGSALSLPHEVEHCFRSLSRSPLVSVAERGAAMGYGPSEIAEHDGKYFSVDLVTRTILDEKSILDESERMLQIADEIGVAYRGWGAYVVRAPESI